MKTKKVPMRQCVACHTSRPKKELLRIVRMPDGGLMVDQKGKVSGRGAYLCPRLECVEQGVKSKRLERALESAVPSELIAALEEIAKGAG